MKFKFEGSIRTVLLNIHAHELMCHLRLFSFYSGKVEWLQHTTGPKYLLSNWCITEKVGPPLDLHVANPASKATVNKSIS